MIKDKTLNIAQIIRTAHRRVHIMTLFVVLILLSSNNIVNGQIYYQVDIGIRDSIILSDIDLYPQDSLLYDSVMTWISHVQDQGYLETSIDHIQVSDSLKIGQLHLGPVYKWVQLNNNNIDLNMLDASGIDIDLLSGRVVNLTQLSQIKNKILDIYDNSGYPYAKIWNDQIIIKDSTIISDLFVEPGLLVTYEPIVVDGDVKISSSYLASYLGLKENKIYKKKDLDKISRRLNELSFLSLKKNARALFRRDKARIELPLASRRASRFDFLLGFQPNTGVAGGSVSLTGTFLGDFINQLGQGERIYLAYKKLGVGTQELDLAINYPYILGSPFGFDASFDLYKRDSSYVNIDAELGIQVLLSGQNYVKAFWNNRSTNLAQVDTLMVVANTQNDLDTRFSNFGLEFSWKQLNDPQSPSRGFLIKTRGSLGQRTIKQNQDIINSNPEFYTTLKPSSFQYLIQTDLQYYIPIGKRSTILLRTRGGWINGAEDLFQNQLFRIGGNQILRGFDDESIFASLYGVGTLELRYLLGNNRYFFLFGDGAYTQEHTSDKRSEDYPIGLGMGLRFQTAAGVFSLTYGMGKQVDVPFEFSRSKVHFGYVTFF